jgi:hypothetical protein
MTQESDETIGKGSCSAITTLPRLTLIEGGDLKRQRQWELLDAIVAPVFDQQKIDALWETLNPRGNLKIVRSQELPEKSQLAD